MHVHDGVPADDVGRMRSISFSENSLMRPKFFYRSKGSKHSFVQQKENQSPIGLYRNPLTFFLTNPRFVLLIFDQCSVLLSTLCFCIHQQSSKCLPGPHGRQNIVTGSKISL